jgi:hypothetical protein
MVEIIAIVTAVTDSLETLGVLPYVFAGGVIVLIGLLARSAKKAAR